MSAALVMRVVKAAQEIVRRMLPKEQRKKKRRGDTGPPDPGKNQSGGIKNIEEEPEGPLIVTVRIIEFRGMTATPT